MRILALAARAGQTRYRVWFCHDFFACLARLMFHRGMNAPFKMAPDIHNAFQEAIVGVHDWNVNLVAPDA